ncbi:MULTISPECIES: hypothetical protein [unclassified Fictibacillus]|uniref:hypothetical protein n=1 Tax=unclassified Fictibacillus TaxID=2644029 RepID=UPI0006A7ABB8|nr:MULTISPECIES: hypothetical protein [unclassified Fictibacillus]MED2974656.1 hypothetical protein [Fictibacillus sp. B-59209]UZJ78665.1 hypothetical protein OKX00_21535 [Fictibacillus sp. KU28468]
MPFFKTILNALTNHDKNMEEIHLHLKQLQNELAEMKKDNNGPPVVIEHINIETLRIDKYELSNNFANLGIKDLKGKLNIGANYGRGMTLQEEADQAKMTENAMMKMGQKKEKVHQKKQNVPSYSIKGRKP